MLATHRLVSLERLEMLLQVGLLLLDHLLLLLLLVALLAAARRLLLERVQLALARLVLGGEAHYLRVGVLHLLLGRADALHALKVRRLLEEDARRVRLGPLGVELALERRELLRLGLLGLERVFHIGQLGLPGLARASHRLHLGELGHDVARVESGTTFNII